MKLRLTQADFLERMGRLHPNYDFSKFTYAGNAVMGPVICPTHGEFQSNPNRLTNLQGCPGCWADRRGSARAMKFVDFIVLARAVHGDNYVYSSRGWVGSTKPIVMFCKKHGKPFTDKPTHHLAGKKCPLCSKESRQQALSTPQEDFLRKCREVHGDTYDLSKVVYTRSNKAVEVGCKDHGPFFPRAGNFINSKSGCPVCARESTGLQTRRSAASYITQASSLHAGRFTYGAITYADNIAMLEVICPDHGMFTQRVADHLKGIGCSKCSVEVYDQESFLTKAAKVHGNTYDYSKTVYKNALTKVVITCREHGDFEQTPNSHTSGGQGCRKCSQSGPSRGQLEIAEYVAGIEPCVIDHRFSGRSELDVFIPGKSLGIEFNGLIWHSEKYAKTLRRDHAKSLLAAAQGVRVLHIYQDEWERRRPVIEKLLRSALGHDDRTFARATRVAEVDHLTASAFLEANHIQGAVPAGVEHIGLYLKTTGNLVAVMTFSRVTSLRGSTLNNAEVELRRFASSMTVVGGASKLLQAYLRSHQGVSTVVSYSENRLFTGQVYVKMGFTKVTDGTPDYWYVSSSSRLRYNKARFQRRHLPALLGSSFDPEKSEVENCNAAGWYRLFDCGKSKWVLKV
jgi:hypothetical protein